MNNAERLSAIDPSLKYRSHSSKEQWLGNVRFESDLGHLTKERLIGIVSSHSSRNQFANAWWQRRMQAALQFAQARNARIVFAADSPFGEAIRHACTRLSVRYAEIHTEKSLTEPSALNHSLGRIVRIHSYGGSIDPALAKTPLSDRAIAFLAEFLIAIYVRPNGKLLKILEARISDSNYPPGSTWLAMHPKPSKSQRCLEQALSNAGAILWMFRDEQPSIAPVGFTSPWGCLRRNQPATLAPVLKATPSLLESDDYLIHCTRSRQGPWPDQSLEGFLDEALRLEVHEPSTPASTLARILTLQRINATNDLKRGKLETSCWSACPLGELLSRRSFQSHLGRWDWEPFGIAIRTQRLAELGAKPVNYVQASALRKLPAEEQPFAQPVPAHVGDRDWSEEREWRIAGDLRLHSIDFPDAFVFTPDQITALQMAPLSRWPVCFIH